MRKTFSLGFILFTLLSCSLVGCASTSNQLDAEITQKREMISTLDSEITMLQQEKDNLASEVAKRKEETGTAVYVVTINIAQSHFTFDLEELMKDQMNDIDIEIPVSKEFYDSVEKGTVLDDSFRMGSFLFKSSIGSWKITVKDKRIE